MIRIAVLAMLLALPASAQQTVPDPVQDPAPDAVEHGAGAVLRGLDKVNGQTTDFEVGRGGVAQFGRLSVELRDCRYPTGNPAGDAYAWITIRADGAGVPLFDGWMIASSPALNALDHPRFDVWVIRCQT